MIPIMQAKVLPPEVEAKLSEIVEDAQQACFALIGARLEVLGYPVSGDFSPHESYFLDACFSAFVHSMAMNNRQIAILNDD